MNFWLYLLVYDHHFGYITILKETKHYLLAIGLTWINCYCSYSYFVAITIALNAIRFCNKLLNNLYIFQILAFSFLNSEVLSMLGNTVSFLVQNFAKMKKNRKP